MQTLPMYKILFLSQGLSGKLPQKSTVPRDTQQLSQPTFAIPFPAPW